MENPVEEIGHVIRSLTQTPPHIQRYTINRYFTPNASFTHPFCRTGSFENSRWVIGMIYRWYKIMSPHIDLDVTSVAYDEKMLRLYVEVHQIFSIWLVPFYAANVSLVTVIDLAYDKPRQVYLIKSQNDLYQTTEFIKFFWPGGWVVAMLWQYVATLLSILGALILWPVTLVEDKFNLG
ncbi:MAG: hypothetical protein M1838_003203 [Thelocarpon superellum]|nr:MAG: hypothetical protein M1838_003203 [Thelocarpon superellum]